MSDNAGGSCNVGGRIRPVLADVAICVALAAAIGAAFIPLAHSGFIEHDDRDYVVSNTQVQKGLTREGVAWAFTTLRSTNWHPLTWLSLMADTSIYKGYSPDDGGPDPFGYHFTNLLLHIANSILLYFAIRSLTGARTSSAVVAALFAIHPLHVESVAWIAERKDVLSAFFWMLTLLAYSAYARRSSVFRYSAVFAALTLGLLAKPMLVTLPFVLLLLDYWPLQRFAPNHGPFRVRLLKLTLEKLPLFALAAASCAITLYAQHGAMPTAQQLPFSFRLANALLSYARYIGKMFYPVNLALHYPHAVKHTPVVLAVCAAVGLALVTTIIALIARKRPYTLVGWLWFLGTLVPVIGLVQVGSQAFADRYTYIPLIGLFIGIAWAAADAVAWRPNLRVPIGSAGLAALLTLVILTHRQAGYWRTNDLLFTRVLEVTGDNVVAHDALGHSAMARGDYATAAHHFSESLRIRPGLIDTLDNYGAALTKLGRYDEAVIQFRRAIKLDSAFANPQNHWGLVYYEMGQVDEAIARYRYALELDPDYADALSNLGAALLSKGKPNEAAAYLSKAVALAPREASYHLNLALSLDIRSDTPGAIEHAEEAVRLDPHFTKAIDFLRTLQKQP